MVKPSFKSLTGRSRTVCVGCGYSGVRFGDVPGQDTRQWVKVNHESGLGLCSSCDTFLLQERQRRQRHDPLFSCGFTGKKRKMKEVV
ncbi:hypothetical protein [Escherichia marmotae]|uniref:hypothetical protein n=1 Tax=Escherichia TaxID=561 RepID=UPI001F4DBF46|nr:hypothetical protein [Escherichia marmotae]MED0362688.1 hypothetical protein [Escherichia marmotae]MED8774695.1 hypothetical protein [Escherichia marmotae]UNH35348.1 hypothetical protein MNY74_02170 [Escherichia marmotae]